jgi:hypothetical protein
MLRYLLEKKFKQFFRNHFLPRMVVVMPYIIKAIFPRVANCVELIKLLTGIIKTTRQKHC